MSNISEPGVLNVINESNTNTRRQANSGAAVKKNPPHYNINKLIADSTEPEVWLNHLNNDLLKFWDRDEATTLIGDLFPTYRTNSGEVLPADKKDWPPEFKAAAEAPDTAGLIDPNYNYIRAHSRQVYAYGFAYHMTGKAHYLQLCYKGLKALEKAIDGNCGMFTKQNKKTGEWKPEKQERISQDMAYGLTGFAMFYMLTHDQSTLANLVKVKNYIFDTYFDIGKGYLTWFPKNQKEYDAEIVSQLDQVYAYMLFVTPSLPEPLQSEWKKDLRMLVNVMINRFYSERYGFFWGVDSSSSTQQLGVDHTDFGHSVKTMWLILRVGLLIDEPAFVTFARTKIAKILDEAYIHETGSWARRFNADGSLDIDKEWWILAELDQACQLLALNDPSYLDYLNNTHKYWLEYMVDKEYGEIWHYLDGKTNKPLLRYPKAHSWKTSLHSFEHCFFGYVLSSQIKNRPVTLYYAFPNEKFSHSRVRPYMFDANIIRYEAASLENIIFPGEENDAKRITKVTFDTIR
jgi:mannose/cellobiose epimerase-like protein (N-acyl-D-glucosamine 2-epimerase family)